MCRINKNFPVLIIIMVFCLAVLGGCAQEPPEKMIEVIPGKGIAGVELGMSKERVMSILGSPRLSLSARELTKIGKEFASFLDIPSEDISSTKVFVFSTPPLYVAINKQNKVIQLNLGRCANVVIQGYPFFRFDYITLEDLNRLGSPRTIQRNQDYAAAILASLPKGADIEYFDFSYDHPMLALGLIFDKQRQKDSRRYIKPNCVKIIYKKPA